MAQVKLTYVQRMLGWARLRLTGQCQHPAFAHAGRAANYFFICLLCGGMFHNEVPTIDGRPIKRSFFWRGKVRWLDGRGGIELSCPSEGQKRSKGGRSTKRLGVVHASS